MLYLGRKGAKPKRKDQRTEDGEGNNLIDGVWEEE